MGDIITKQSLSGSSRNEGVSAFKQVYGKQRYFHSNFTNLPAHICQWRIATLRHFQ